jgi:hypothetical protein
VNRDEILNMPAGRELDALIAERVMGLKVDRRNDGTPHYLTWTPYSTDMSAAWEIVRAMEEKREWFKLGNVIPNSDAIVYEASFGDAYACEDTAPLAICRAALLAVMEAS